MFTVLLKYTSKHACHIMPSRAIHGHPIFWSFTTFKVNCGLPNPTWLGVSSALGIHPYFGLFLQSVPVMFNKFNRLLAFSGKNCGFCKVQVADQAVETDRKSRFFGDVVQWLWCTLHGIFLFWQWICRPQSPTSHAMLTAKPKALSLFTCSLVHTDAE